MGARLSMNNQNAGATENYESPQFEPRKRQKTCCSSWDDNPRLIPNLPDEISIQILARIPRISLSNAKLVSRKWRTALMSEELYTLRKELKTTEEWLYVLTKLDGEKLMWYALDPISKIWQRLPPMPHVSFEQGCNKWSLSALRIADAIRGWFGRRSTLAQIPFCGCAIGAVNGCLYVMGGFKRSTAMNSVWRYSPISNSWLEVNPMSIGRAYCKTGVLNDKLYVVGGVARGHDGLRPLQSAEVFDPFSGQWSEVPNMPFSKAQVLPTAFLADLLKPIATGMTSYRGKLYVPQSLYCWPFFVDVGGEVYDPNTNSWAEMPAGMGEGWPAKQAGTKLSVIIDDELYALDPSNNLDSARIKFYDQQDDSWKAIEGDLPIVGLTDSESPYLLAGMKGKLHVITKGENHNISVVEASKLYRSGSSSSPGNNIDESSSELHEDVSSFPEHVWRVVATMNVGSAELVSCQILDV